MFARCCLLQFFAYFAERMNAAGSVLLLAVIGITMMTGCDQQPKKYTLSIKSESTPPSNVYHLTKAKYEDLKKNGEERNPEKWNGILGTNVTLNYGSYVFLIVRPNGEMETVSKLINQDGELAVK
jgi:hypothetical protein